MIKALSNGTIDVALPLFRDYWLAEQTGVIQSNSMGTVSLTAIHSGKNLNSDLKNIACTKSTIVNRFELESLFPNATVTEYSNDGEVLKALNEGRHVASLSPARAWKLSATSTTSRISKHRNSPTRRNYRV